MAKKVSFSGENLTLDDAALHHNDTESALRLFFSPASPSFPIRFAGYEPVEVREELGSRLIELDRNTSMTLLAAVEAAFRIDYLKRCYQKKRDRVSRQLRQIYQTKGTHASLEDEIFTVWKNNTVGGTAIIAELRAAFKFRHWMAHGRYWTPKLGQKYDYIAIYQLAIQTLTAFPLIQ